MMDKEVFWENVCFASKQYVEDFVEKHIKEGVSVKDLMAFYDPDVRNPAINLREFVENYLDEMTRSEWEKQSTEKGGRMLDGVRYVEYMTNSLITSLFFDTLDGIGKEYVDKEALDIVMHDPLLWENLDLKKKEKGNDFDLISEVRDYIYKSVVIDYLQCIDAYQEPTDESITDWCESHSNLIREKYAEFGK